MNVMHVLDARITSTGDLIDLMQAEVNIYDLFMYSISLVIWFSLTSFKGNTSLDSGENIHVSCENRIAACTNLFSINLV